MRERKEEDEELPDDVTRDKYLRSLRRQRRVQLEEIEKEKLKNEIAEFNKARMRKYLWGIKEGNMRKQALAKAIKKKKMEIGKKKANILANNGQWLNKYKL
jgi:hypothetical protein